jgi:hypothetical protein
MRIDNSIYNNNVKIKYKIILSPNYIGNKGYNYIGFKRIINVGRRGGTHREKTRE